MNNQADTIDDQVKALAGASDRPSLVALTYSLRHPETWPAGFVWDYSRCTSCAIGLATKLWPESDVPLRGRRGYLYNETMKSWIARIMAVPLGEAADIFFNLAPTVTETGKVGWFRRETKSYIDWEAIYPEDVADAIDRYIASVD